jgi:hypothetical protein
VLVKVGSRPPGFAGSRLRPVLGSVGRAQPMPEFRPQFPPPEKRPTEMFRCFHYGFAGAGSAGFRPAASKGKICLVAGNVVLVAGHVKSAVGLSWLGGLGPPLPPLDPPPFTHTESTCSLMSCTGVLSLGSARSGCTGRPPTDPDRPSAANPQPSTKREDVAHQHDVTAGGTQPPPAPNHQLPTANPPARRTAGGTRRAWRRRGPCTARAACPVRCTARVPPPPGPSCPAPSCEQVGR